MRLPVVEAYRLDEFFRLSAVFLCGIKPLAALDCAALSAEDGMTRLFAVGEEQLSSGKYYSVADDLRIVRELTVDKLNDVMRKYPFDNPFTIAVGPLDSLRDY